MEKGEQRPHDSGTYIFNPGSLHWYNAIAILKIEDFAVVILIFVFGEGIH